MWPSGHEQISVVYAVVALPKSVMFFYQTFVDIYEKRSSFWKAKIIIVFHTLKHENIDFKPFKMAVVLLCSKRQTLNSIIKQVDESTCTVAKAINLQMWFVQLLQAPYPLSKGDEKTKQSFPFFSFEVFLLRKVF